MQAVLNALEYCMGQYYKVETFTIVHNFKRENCKDRLKIAGATLSMSDVGKKPWPVYCYVSAVIQKSVTNTACAIVQKDNINTAEVQKDTTNLMFIPTRHGWYWTPAERLLPNHSINWMAVTQSNIVHLVMEEMCKFNVNYLKDD